LSCHLFLPTETLLDTAILSYATVRNIGTIIGILVKRHTYLAKEAAKEVGKGNTYISIPSGQPVTVADVVRSVYKQDEWFFFRKVRNILEDGDKRGYVTKKNMKMIDKLLASDKAPYPSWVFWENFFLNEAIRIPRNFGEVVFKVSPWDAWDTYDDFVYSTKR